jgi:hypothetical protein
VADSHPFVCKQGTTFRRRLVFKDANQSPVPTTGYTGIMQIRLLDDSGNSPPVLELSTSNGRITMGGADGSISLLLDANTTASLPSGTYEYDLFITEPGAGGATWCILPVDTFTVVRRVTR